MSLAGAHARAESALPTITFNNCAALAQDDVRRIAGIELAGGANLSAARVIVACEQRFIHLRAELSGNSVEKVLPVGAVDAHSRPRLVALATAELLHELARLLSLPPSPPRARALPPPRDPERWEATLGPTMLVPTRGRLLLWGGHIQAHFKVLPWFAVGLGLELAQGSRDITGGSLRMRTTGMSLGLRLSHDFAYVRPFVALELSGSLDALRGSPDDARLTGDSFTTRNLGGRLTLGAAIPFANHGLASVSGGVMGRSRALHAEHETAPTTEIGPFYACAALSVGARW